MIVIVNELPVEQWRDYVATHPRGTIFHTPEMYEVFGRARNHEPMLWAATNGVGKILALFIPVRIMLRGGFLRRVTTRVVAYDSVLHDAGTQGEAALVQLLNAYTEELGGKALFTELRNLFDLAEIQPILGECGFVYQDHLNFLVDLDRPAEDVLQSMGSRMRKHIRRGLRKGEVLVEEITDRCQIQVWYELVKKSYVQAEMPLADLSLFEAAFDVLQPAGMIKFWLARVDGTPVAASAELVFRDRVYGWYGGLDREYSSFMPGEMLTWHILEWGAENGHSVYDFGGAGKPDAEYGVRDFKAKFGGDLVCFGRNTYVHSPRLLRLSEFGYRLSRPLLHRL
jgi:serine/alanine adding enzyme